MYTYREACVLDRSPYAQWQSVDLSTLSLSAIFQTYRRIILILDHTAVPGTYYVDLEPLRLEYSGYLYRLTQWLTDLGDRTLPTIQYLPHPTVSYVRYTDAVRAGYKVELTIIGRTDISIAEQEDRIDLKVTRAMPIPYDVLYNTCLFSVNGYLHPTDYNDLGLYVREGGRSYHHCRLNHLGIHSFADIGTVQCLPITNDQITPSTPDSQLRNHAYLQIPIATPGKTVLLSIGGYLVLPDAATFWQVGDQTYGLTLENLPYLERYFESSQYLDLSSLPLSTSPLHPERISAVELWSDPVIRAYLTLPQSFWIVVDTPHLFTVRRSLRSPGLPGMFVSVIEPRAAVITGYGKIAEYWQTYEDGQWSLTVEDSFYRHYVFDTVPSDQLTVITAGLTPMHSYSHSRGYLLEIGAYRDRTPSTP